jgi:hypothetical protein
MAALYSVHPGWRHAAAEAAVAAEAMATAVPTPSEGADADSDADAGTANADAESEEELQVIDAPESAPPFDTARGALDELADVEATIAEYEGDEFDDFDGPESPHDADSAAAFAAPPALGEASGPIGSWSIDETAKSPVPMLPKRALIGSERCVCTARLMVVSTQPTSCIFELDPEGCTCAAVSIGVFVPGKPFEHSSKQLEHGVHYLGQLSLAKEWVAVQDPSVSLLANESGVRWFQFDKLATGVMHAFQAIHPTLEDDAMCGRPDAALIVCPADVLPPPAVLPAPAKPGGFFSQPSMLQKEASRFGFGGPKKAAGMGFADVASVMDVTRLIKQKSVLNFGKTDSAASPSKPAVPDASVALGSQEPEIVAPAEPVPVPVPAVAHMPIARKPSLGFANIASAVDVSRLMKPKLAPATPRQTASLVEAAATESSSGESRFRPIICARRSGPRFLGTALCAKSQISLLLRTFMRLCPQCR